MHKIHVLQNEFMYCNPKRGYLTIDIIFQTKKRLAPSLKLT